MDNTLSPETKSYIEDIINKHKVVLFMKGDKFLPQCGFSATVVDILKKHTEEFVTYDILAEPELRSGLKVFSNWPTFPQLYVNQEFIGGCDIVKEMDEANELADLLNQ